MPVKAGAVRGAKKLAEVKDGGPPPSLGGQVCDFIEYYAIHGEGDFVGERLKLHADLERMIWRMYELEPGPKNDIKNAEMVARWSEVVNVGPKDIGKSLTSAAVGLADAFGPVQFDGWDAHGDPVGKPRDSVRVVCVGTEEGQARNSYAPLVWMIDKESCSDEFREDFGVVDIGKKGASSSRVFLPKNRGLITPITAGAASKEGRKASLIIAEEVHLWDLPELVNLYLSMKRALIKRRNAMLLHSTNFYDPTARSALQVAVESIEAGTEKRSLLIGNFLPPGFLDDDKPVADQPKRKVEAALKIVYGSAWSFVNKAGIIDYVHSGTTPDGDARRYALNQARTSKGKWMSAKLWADRTSSATLQPGDLIALGFDGGRYRDSTALVATRLSDRLQVLLGVWERPENATKDWEVPEHLVTEAVRSAFTTYTVTRMYGDPPKWREQMQSWAIEHGEESVAAFETNQDRKMAFAIDRFEEAVKTGQLSHVGDAVLTRHVLAAETMQTTVKVEIEGDQPRRGVRLIKPVGVDPGTARSMIDAAVAAILSHEAACDSIAAGLDRPAKKKEVHIW